MRTTLLIISTALAGMSVLAGENPVPTPAAAERYAKMSQHSPFALATAGPAPVPVGPSFAANWYVAGIARDGDVDFVTIKSRDATIQFSLRGKEPQREQGVVLEGINWSEELFKSTVSIRKGSELALLQFNEAVVHGPSAIAAGATKGAGASAKVTVVATVPGAPSNAVPVSVAPVGTRPVETAAGAGNHRRLVQIPVPR